jgi:hypothetical protein
MKFHNATVSYLHAAKHGKSFSVPGPEQSINHVFPIIIASDSTLPSGFNIPDYRTIFRD